MLPPERSCENQIKNQNFDTEKNNCLSECYVHEIEGKEIS